jgi:hypothetical protein
MQTNSTHITMILDRSGSMEAIREDTIGGFNAFVEEQQRQPGTVTLTLVQFDGIDPYEVLQHFAPIEKVLPLTQATFVPRSSTPLLDALGRGINDLAQTLTTLPPAQRPQQIIFVVVTDGEENASREFTKLQVSQMIAERQQQDWQFVFLSADLAAISEAEATGVLASHAMAYDKTAQGTRDAWTSVSKNTSAYRAQVRKDMAFDEGDRLQQQSEQQRRPQRDS